jgi:hypothetical protein
MRLGDGETHSLTLFCSCYGISATQIDGEIQSRIGTPDAESLAITYYLGPHETITSAYVARITT